MPAVGVPSQEKRTAKRSLLAGVWRARSAGEQVVQKGDPLAEGGLLAGDQIGVRPALVDRYRIEELRPELFVGVTKPERSRGDV